MAACLGPDDYVTYTYRGHGICIARGMSMARAMAEIFGRTTGVSSGLGGSMHLTDPSLNLFASAGIVGGGVPVAVGAGSLSAKIWLASLKSSATLFGRWGHQRWCVPRIDEHSGRVEAPGGVRVRKQPIRRVLAYRPNHAIRESRAARRRLRDEFP